MPGGAGLLFTTEVTRADLGRHGGRHLRGRAERRTLRIGLGKGRGLLLYGSRLRPVAVEVTEADDRRYEVPVLTCWVVASAVLSAARLLRTKLTAS